MWLNIRTEFSFRQVYGHLKTTAERCAEIGKVAGIADEGNTFGHVKWRSVCETEGIKPVYGVRLAVSDPPNKIRRYPYDTMTFVALTQSGLEEIYHLVDLAHQQFYYRPRITYDQLNEISNKVVIFCGTDIGRGRIKAKVFRELSPALPLALRAGDAPYIAAIDNYYPTAADQKIYEPFADERLRQRKTSRQWILTEAEWKEEFSNDDALRLLKDIGDAATVDLKVAPMISFPSKKKFRELCKKGAREKKVNLEKKEYKKRLKRELKLIKEKGYEDYFLIVSDLINEAKKKMVVGPGRGSSAGSLVCYLLGITNVDPIEYGLFFERFIDINRHDLPDIDIDFADDKRHLVLSYLDKKYGSKNVAQLGNISRLKPRSAIARFSKAFQIPDYKTEEIKEIADGGSLHDAITSSAAGKVLIEEHPEMGLVESVEDHASHSSVHAAGVVVCSTPITQYCGVNSRDRKRIAMIDKGDAEALNLLKIDALGLRTLSVLAEVCDQIKKPYEWLSLLPDDDKKTYKVFKNNRFTGIFQFEGDSMRKLASRCPVKSIEDISALTSIARPGPMASGGAEAYIRARSGASEVSYLSDHKSYISATKETCGVLIYQEQVLKICREYGKLSWKDTGVLRKALSKSKGSLFFDNYLKKFVKGAVKNGRTEEEAVRVWDHIKTFGGYGFNKAHAVSYSYISYMCAYCKAHHPMEFAVASLNHSKNNRAALKLLRDLFENEKIEHIPFDQKISGKNWICHEGKLYGGLLTIDGIGPAAANKVLAARKTGSFIPAGIAKKMEEMKTPFESIYPAVDFYGHYYTQSHKHCNCQIAYINAIQKKGQCFFIGQLIKKDVRSVNEPDKVKRRRGRVFSENVQYLNLIIEDDTGTMPCTIDRFNYQKMGKEIAENGEENEDWYLISAFYQEKYERCYIKEIKKITGNRR